MINYLNVIIISAVSTSVMVMVLFVIAVLVWLAGVIQGWWRLRKRKKETKRQQNIENFTKWADYYYGEMR